jgi:hypothetical protein
MLCERLGPEFKQHRLNLLVNKGDVFREGILPGLPDWEYLLDGIFSFMAHRRHGERISIDATRTKEDINGMDFHEWMDSCREPGPAARRLRELFPGGRGMHLPLHFLRHAGVLRDISYCDFVVCRSVRRYSTAAVEFLTQWQEPGRRLGLAVAIGDWLAALAAAQAAGRTDCLTRIGACAEQCRKLWLRRLRRYVQIDGLDHDVLFALADAQAADLPQYLDRALADRNAASAALKIIADDPSWCARVFHLFGRIDAVRCGLNGAYARYLIRHQYRVDDVMDQLSSHVSPR